MSAFDFLDYEGTAFDVELPNPKAANIFKPEINQFLKPQAKQALIKPTAKILIKPTVETVSAR